MNNLKNKLNTQSSKIMINVGCGNIHHKDWINFDVLPSDDVIKFNLKNKLPIPNNRADVVYHSHVLEHLTKQDGENFIKDCFRVLKPGGIIRIAVPDLEQICKEYLHNLNQAYYSKNEKEIKKHYWNTLELFDQMVRNESGGEMLKATKENKVDKDYIITRNGDEMQNSFDNSVIEAKRNKYIKILKKVIKKIFSHKYNPQKNGEAHKWMYDKLSLSLLLEKTGFKNIIIRDFESSYIPNWKIWELESSKQGNKVRKPDSLFIEAIK